MNTMIDGFPLAPTAADRAIQLLINEDLENCQVTQTAFEVAYPKGKDQESVSARIQNTPKPDQLYPKLYATADLEPWLPPLLRRFEWHLTGASKVWAARLAAMIQKVNLSLKHVSEADFLLLTQQVPGLREHRSYGLLESIAKFARQMERQGLLSDPVVAALQDLLTLWDGKREPSADRAIFVWPLFRAENGFRAADLCWAARVRHDLATLDSSLCEKWLNVFTGDRHDHWEADGGPLKRGMAAIAKLGQAQLQAGLRRWVPMVDQIDTPAFSEIDTIIFRHVVVLCTLLGEKQCSALLYDIARIPWRNDAKNEQWIRTYLKVLGEQSQDRAFACLEALAMNPATATDDVKREYQALLTVFGTHALPSGSPGVDGYSLDLDSALSKQQERIDRIMRLVSDAVARGPYVDAAVAHHVEALKSVPEEKMTPAMKLWLTQLTARPAWFDPGPEIRASLKAMEKAILRDFASDPESLHAALSKRLEWIEDHRKDYSPETFRAWKQVFSGLGCDEGLVPQSLKKIDNLQLKPLLRAIRTGSGRWKAFELAEQYVAEHGWDADLVKTLRAWIPSLGTSHTSNEYRAKVEWFLWFEDVLPIDPEDCWSSRVRQDLRSMTAKERKGWLALLENYTFKITESPTKKWLASAEAALPKIGAVAFRKYFRAWFAPFGKGEPLKLTITGRNVLRHLMWTALIAKDRKVDEALAGYAQAKWKNKETEKRISQADMAFAFVLAERAPESAAAILEDWVATGRAFRGSAAHEVYRGLCRKLGRRAVTAKQAKQAADKKPKPAIKRVTKTPADKRSLVLR